MADDRQTPRRRRRPQAAPVSEEPVRIIVGTLLEVGRGYWPPEQVQAILEAKDRKQAGPTAPPEGLCLMKVDY